MLLLQLLPQFNEECDDEHDVSVALVANESDTAEHDEEDEVSVVSAVTFGSGDFLLGYEMSFVRDFLCIKADCW